MAIFRKSIHRIDCDECRLMFVLSEGGACVECRRILCGRHLYSGLFDRLRVSITGRAICPRCRAGAAATR